MKAKDIMSTDIKMTDEEITVAKIIDKMLKNNVASLIVDRSHDDDSYGIVTRRDIINKVVATGGDPHKLKVKDIMIKPLLIVTPNLSIRDIARLMVHTGVRRMPVFDGHKIIGIVSNSDIFTGYGKNIDSAKKFVS